MKIHILGLFPDILDHYFSQSLLGKARDKGIVEFLYHQLRDWAVNDYGMVDDKPYGGTAGMVFRPDAVCRAVRELKQKHAVKKVILTSPAGKLLTAQKARELSKEESVLFLCGRYEGVDQRAIDLVVDEEISIGDYVLSGGELAAGVIVDTMCRYIPGVVGDQQSVDEDSHENGLLEYPQYTRPETFENSVVPEVLLSGNHKNIEEWRRREAIRRTWSRRPDLLKKAQLSKEELEYIKDLIHKR
jgi:tRNA (guanine37-N1)-methyltransferase